jgi:hypothetical protein
MYEELCLNGDNSSTHSQSSGHGQGQRSQSDPTLRHSPTSHAYANAHNGGNYGMLGRLFGTTGSLNGESQEYQVCCYAFIFD